MHRWRLCLLTAFLEGKGELLLESPRLLTLLTHTHTHEPRIKAPFAGLAPDLPQTQRQPRTQSHCFCCARLISEQGYHIALCCVVHTDDDSSVGVLWA